MDDFVSSTRVVWTDSSPSITSPTTTSPHFLVLIQNGLSALGSDLFQVTCHPDTRTQGHNSFKAEVTRLGGLFIEYFKKYQSEATEDVIKAGPAF
jgi:hypothetical protein